MKIPVISDNDVVIELLLCRRDGEKDQSKYGISTTSAVRAKYESKEKEQGEPDPGQARNGGRERGLRVLANG
jgi:hypothetical protein